MVDSAPGWFLAGGPTGTVLNGAAGSLYTFKAGDVSYETIATGTPLTGGEAVWAYFPAPASIVLPQVPPQTVSVPLQAGGYVMAGNPGCNVALASGADSMLLYSFANNVWVPQQPPFVLAPGQGAFFFSHAGGTLTIANIP